MTQADGNSNDRDQRLWRQYADSHATRGPCPEPEELAAWLDGRAGDGEKVEAHVADCAACREAVADLREWLTDGEGRLPMAPPHVLAKARGLVRGPVVATGRRDIRSLARWSLAAAASIAVCMVGYRVGWNASGGPAPEFVVYELTFGLIGDEPTDAAYDLFGFAAEMGGVQ